MHYIKYFIELQSNKAFQLVKWTVLRSKTDRFAMQFGPYR